MLLEKDEDPSKQPGKDGDLSEQPAEQAEQEQEGNKTRVDSSSASASDAVRSSFRNCYAQWDAYTLFVDAYVKDVDKIPSSEVHVDDLTMAFVLQKCGQKKLHERWPADSDKHGMSRATRVSLGHAAKFYIDGNVLKEGDWYYMWWKGFSLLVREGSTEQQDIHATTVI